MTRLFLQRLASLALLLALLAPALHAQTTFTVTKTADTDDGACDSDCSLREAVAAANANAGADVITVPVTGTIPLGSNLNPTESVDIRGPSADQLTIDGGGASRHFLLGTEAGAQNYVISGLTLSNGSSTNPVSSGFGSSILMAFGGRDDTLTLDGCHITGNMSTDGVFGAAVYVQSVFQITVNRSSITENIGSSGGVSALSIASVNMSTLANSTVSGNSGSSRTIAYTNNAVGFDATFLLDNVTVAENSGRAVNVLFSGEGSGDIRYSSSIFSNHPSGNFASTGAAESISLGHNISDDATGSLTAAGDLPSTDPLIGPLALNGGATPTHALLSGSPAFDIGGTCGPTDQRGSDAPSGDACDAGAVEVFVEPPPVACAAGSFSDTGNAPCTLAPAGFFVAAAGALEAEGCPVGTYQPDEGAASCLVADPGFYVSDMSSITQLACQPGAFSAVSGVAACTTAPVGTYVDQEAATSATACPAGQTTAAEGSTSASDCFTPAESLTVSITPLGNPDVAHYGGLVFFRVRVDNDTDERLRQDVWLTLTKPSGSERVQYRTRVNLRAGRSARGLFVTFVSRHADAGTYTYTASVGDYPSDATGSDAFSFVKRERSNAKTGDDPVLAMNAFSDAEARTGGAVTEAVELRLDGGDADAVWGDADGAWDAATTEDATVFALATPFPNPAHGQTTVAFSIEAATAVRLTLYDALGRQVAILADGEREAGAHRAGLDAAALPTGVYLVRLTTADGQAATQRLTIVR